MDRKEFAAAIRDEYDYVRPWRGETVQATVLEIGERDMVVDLGKKRDGIISPADLAQVDDEYVNEVEVGDEIPVVIGRPRRDDDGREASLSRGIQASDWLRAQELVESGEPAECEIVGWNRGGVILSFGRARGFVPNSQMRRRPPSGDGARETFMSELVGRTISSVVIDVDQRRHRLVLSQRKADRLARKGILDELAPGQVRTGIVSNLAKFGAFVNLGGVDGLIHISELDHGFVDYASDVLDIGDQVEVLVLDVDRDKERIGLSRKRLLPDTWESGVEFLEIGQETQGTVTGVMRSGMVVELSSGIDGLVPMAELDSEVLSQRDEFVGTVISATILDIDHRRHKVVLRVTERIVEQTQAMSEPDADPESRVVSRIRQQLGTVLR